MNELSGIKTRLKLISEPCWTNERKDGNELGTFLIIVYLQSIYKRTQSRVIVGYTGKIYNDQTLKQFYLKTAPHSDENKPMCIAKDRCSQRGR